MNDTQDRIGEVNTMENAGTGIEEATPYQPGPKQPDQHEGALQRRRITGDMLDKLAHSGATKALMGWKLAICQHPMYLIVDEDRGEPVVGERVPPWGAAKTARMIVRERSS